MTYEAQETSVFAGEPVELYQFKRRADCWRYTSADQDIVHEGATYQAVALSRGRLQRNEETASATIEIMMARTLALPQRFVAGTPETPVKLTITRVHRTDADDIVLFSGEVSNVEFEGGQARVRATSPLSAEEKFFPRILVQRQCPNVLYDAGCGLDPEDFETAGTITQVDVANARIRVDTADGEADGYFTAGFVRVTGTDVRAFIVNHEGEWLTLLEPLGYPVSTAVLIYAGCDRLVDTCHSKFDNLPNFLGFPFHPQRNPFVQLEE